MARPVYHTYEEAQRLLSAQIEDLQKRGLVGETFAGQNRASVFGSYVANTQEDVGEREKTVQAKNLRETDYYNAQNDITEKIGLCQTQSDILRTLLDDGYIKSKNSVVPRSLLNEVKRRAPEVYENTQKAYNKILQGTAEEIKKSIERNKQITAGADAAKDVAPDKERK